MQAPYRLRQSAACASCPGNSAGRQKLDLPSFRATVCNQVLAVHFLRATPKSIRSGARSFECPPDVPPTGGRTGSATSGRRAARE